MQEIWKDIPWYEGIYQVSNLGNVKGLDRIDSIGHNRLGKILYWDIIKWYRMIKLSKNAVKTRIFAHRLVGQTFIPNPENKGQINHKNGIKTDNRVENLEWVTPSENIKHSFNVLWHKKSKAWLWITGWDHCRSKSVQQLYMEWTLLKIWNSISDIERTLWISWTHISAVCKWKRKSAGGFIWQYN